MNSSTPPPRIPIIEFQGFLRHATIRPETSGRSADPEARNHPEVDMGRDRVMREESRPLSLWILALWAGMLALAGWTEGGLFRPTEFEVSGAGLAIKGDPYGRTIPLSELQLARARVIDLHQEPEFRPWLKVNGIGLPSYRSGWHRLKDRGKALVFVSRANRAVYLPTTRGDAILLTPDQPDALLDALRNPGTSLHVFALPDGH
jgi:hypothetical protein